MATLTLIPSAGSDDGYAYSTTFNNSDARVLIGRIADPTRSFFRMQNVTIPRGSLINSATVTIKANGDRGDNINIYVAASAEDNAAAPANYTEVLGKTLTTAKSSLWSFTTSGTSTHTSPSLTSVIQEIVNRSGWNSGNSLLLIFYDNGANNDYSYIYSYEGSSTNCATLTIDYTPAIVTTSLLTPMWFM